MDESDKKSYVKLDTLRQIETQMQTKWAEEKIFEVDAPLNASMEKNKFMATFPYPYMNGRLHIGHSFSLSKCEFAIGFERLQGKHCLFPFGFHATGMPIKACADKLKYELETFGFPPEFPAQKAADPAATNTNVKVKSKVAAKGGTTNYQWNIMKSFGLSDDEIRQFVDPLHWLRYFPKCAMSDLKNFGLKVDWRRSFITTDINPFYDSFVRWQFWKLKEYGFVKFGKRYTIFSPKDQQPCMDHDRASGEGIGPQEYTVYKLRLSEAPLLAEQQQHQPLNDLIKNKKVFLLAATLRPETIFGVTNCWLHPDITYVVYKSFEGDDVYYVSTKRAARNASYQGLTNAAGEYNVVAEIKGSLLFGGKIVTPSCAHYKQIFVLPMLTIKEDKGTGIVMSVPSDSPDDYATLVDLKNKAALRDKFSVNETMLLDPIEIISVPDYGELCAKLICEKLKIQSQNDTDKLANAKDTIYKSSFYEGKIIYSNHYQNMLIKDAKPLIQKEMITSGDCFIYKEPEGRIVSRSGDECVVALCDQWYLNYGESEWKSKAVECLQQMETYCEETKNNFIAVLDWLHEHACARSFGLGTKLPWDPVYLVESLSDSTIHMSYYTIAHLLQGNTLDGSNPNTLGITADQLTNEVWDYIFLKDTPYPNNNCTIEQSKLDQLRNEFQYWYGVDLRVSGKDLIPNHLTYYLYNHVAIWPNDTSKWPKGVRANGHLLLNSEKMSKSTGNFLTLNEALGKYGADAVRLALADSGDTIEDANFVEKIADNTVLRLYTFLEWAKETIENAKKLSSTDDLSIIKSNNIFEKLFQNDINYAIVKSCDNYRSMLYREALKCGFYELQNAKDLYREYCSKSGIEENIHLLIHFIHIQIVILAPFCPHICEYIFGLLGGLPWMKTQLNNCGSIMNARWPTVTKYDHNLRNISRFIEVTSKNFRARLKNKKDAQLAVIYTTDKYNDWQTQIIKFLAEFYHQNKTHSSSFPDNKQLVAHIKKDPILKSINSKQMNKVMSFVQYIKTCEQTEGASALNLTTSFNEKEILHEILPYLIKSLAVASIEIADSSSAATDNIKEQCSPGNPVIFFS